MGFPLSSYLPCLTLIRMGDGRSHPTHRGVITGPIVAITLVLSSVLLPSAFLGGITGQFFKQFALTISVSMLISAVNAMTMTPARAAWIFAGRGHGGGGKEALPWWVFGLVGGLATVWLL